MMTTDQRKAAIAKFHATFPGPAREALLDAIVAHDEHARAIKHGDETAHALEVATRVHANSTEQIAQAKAKAEAAMPVLAEHGLVEAEPPPES